VTHPAPTANTPPEWKLLLAASSAAAHGGKSEYIRALLNTSIDWNSVLRLADQHGTSSLLYQDLAPLVDLLPSTVLTPLRQSYERNIHKSLFLTRELIRILDCLDGLGIEAIPYKGVVLSEVYYGDMALRRSGDMDLFVRKQDVGRIKNAVRELGYVPRVHIPEDAEQDYIESGYECTFDSSAGKNLLELQWALQPRFYAVDFDMESVFERAVEATVGGRRMKTPCAEDLALILSMHAAKHVWGRLIWLCDIEQVVKQGNIDWDWIQSQARQLGIERILHITLLLTKNLLGGAIPATIESAILSDGVARKFAEQIALSVAAGVVYEEEKISYFRLMMRLRERRIDRVRFLSRLTFTPGPGEWEAVRLPRLLFPFYRLVRLGRLALHLSR
jgi:hypothetical protein